MKKTLIALLFTTTAFAQSITPEQVLENYFDAIGGKENLEKIEDLSMEMAMDAMGQELTINIIKKTPNKMYMVQSMMGMEVSKIIFDGENLKVFAQGQEMPVDESQVESYLQQAVMIPEFSYFNDNVKMEMMPNETIDGEECYVIDITVDGNTFKEFYSVASGLKVSQEIETQGMVMVQTFKNYQSFKGIKFPTESRSEVMGQAMDTIFNSIKVNSGVSDDQFQID